MSTEHPLKLATPFDLSDGQAAGAGQARPPRSAGQCDRHRPAVTRDRAVRILDRHHRLRRKDVTGAGAAGFGGERELCSQC